MRCLDRPVPPRRPGTDAICAFRWSDAGRLNLFVKGQPPCWLSRGRLPPRDVVLKEHLTHEFAPGPHAGLAEDRLEVVLDGVGRDVQRPSHHLGRVTLHAHLSHLTLAIRQPVGERHQRGDLAGRRRLDDHRDPVIGSAGQRSPVEQQPRPRAGLDPRPSGETERVLSRLDAASTGGDYLYDPRLGCVGGRTPC